MTLEGDSGKLDVDGVDLEKMVRDLAGLDCCCPMLEKGKSNGCWVLHWRRREPEKKGQMELI